MDIEDAHKLKILTTKETQELLINYFDEERQKSIKSVLEKVTDVNEQIVYLRSCCIGALEAACVDVFVKKPSSTALSKIRLSSISKDVSAMLTRRVKKPPTTTSTVVRTWLTSSWLVTKSSAPLSTFSPQQL